MKKKYIIFSIIFVVILGSTIGFYFLKKSIDNKKATTKIEKYIITLGEKVFVNGIITPEKTEDIYLDALKGNVNKVSVENGQIVKKGDILFTYKNDAITEQIEQLNRQITSSKNQKKQLVKKQEDLKKQPQSPSEVNGVPVSNPVESQITALQEQITTVQDQITSVEEQVKSLKGKEYSTITAPVDGKVILHEGAKNLGTAYMSIESNNFYVKGSINEKEQPKLKVNQVAEILILSTNKTVKGKVTSIDNRPISSNLMANTQGSGDSNISNYGVNIALDNQDNLINGFHVQATIKLTDEAIKIPKTSVLEENGKRYVFKEVDKKLVKQEITYTEGSNNEVIVSSGVKEKDTIITKPTAEMKEGNTIE